MMQDGEHTADRPFIPPLCVALGADHAETPHIVAQLAQIVQRRKPRTVNNPLHMLYFNIGDGALASRMVDVCCSPLRISGTEPDTDALEKARELLAHKKSLGVLHALDPSSSPASALKNKFACVGGADMVVYAHGAYPGRLPSFKLSRMIERLGDVVAAHGAVVTLHHYGPCDAEKLRGSMSGSRLFAQAGLHCNTQARLENAFGDAKFYSFSVIVPNYVELPANLTALEALFEGEDAALSGQDAKDAATLRQVLEQIAGGRGALEEVLTGADSLAVHFFRERLAETGGQSLPITIGGGQIVMAFHSLDMAREAFAGVQSACREMALPPILLPISLDVAPECDKHAAYGEWKMTLRKRGIIEPPMVAQMHRMQQTRLSI